MMCDVMPTIVEDASSSSGSRPANEFAEEANFEQLMVDMLHERDKLMENLGEAQDMLQVTQQRLNESEQAKAILIRTLETALAMVSIIHHITKEIKSGMRETAGVLAPEVDT